ncbi:MAG: hypothetical protein CO065_06240 [Comamonadaceae bacterium CG_4_9_14_0_8_um_filter_57_21]|nr:MAG: hypothetical protein AUK50_03715 [Comamonadaceae bacterium CG2_30_57_122]PIZ22057.1 MAG: hypothetical protein COY49_10580 [Comamonadaceae bacterium CG_4_10_14_0_8_um_filter_57_29]PJC20096.1 MAG: hypothetical protein CO065_06240 [Comamonadaceae bacterium CG_4_9_14_0_8_um_filter_57_21]
MFFILGGCRTFGIEAFATSGVAKFDHSEDSFCQICRLIAVAISPKAGEKWIAVVGLQPVQPGRQEDVAGYRPQGGATTPGALAVAQSTAKRCHPNGELTRS